MNKKNLIEIFEKTLNHDSARNFYISLYEQMAEVGYSFNVCENGGHGSIKIIGRTDFIKFCEGTNASITKYTIQYLANVNNATPFEVDISMEEFIHLHKRVNIKKKEFDKFTKENADT